MTLKQRLQNPFIQQYLLEILLPLIGYFFFGWSLAVIAAFYLIDQVASEISFLRKLKAIRKAEHKAIPFLIGSSLILILLMLAIESLSLLCFFAPADPLIVELSAFAKEELWLLFPLVLLMYYVKDQLTFFVPRRYLKKESLAFFRWHWIENLILVALIILGVQLLKNPQPNDVIILAVFLALKLTFDFTIAKISDQKSNRV